MGCATFHLNCSIYPFWMTVLRTLQMFSCIWDLGTIQCTWREPSVKFWICCGWVGQCFSFIRFFSFLYIFLYIFLFILYLYHRSLVFWFCCSILHHQIELHVLSFHWSSIDSYRFILYYIVLYLYAVIHSCIKFKWPFYLFHCIWLHFCNTLINYHLYELHLQLLWAWYNQLMYCNKDRIPYINYNYWYNKNQLYKCIIIEYSFDIR